MRPRNHLKKRGTNPWLVNVTDEIINNEDGLIV
jgi:hypothetical protein